MHFTLLRTRPLNVTGQWCALCGREGQPITYRGSPPLLSIAGSMPPASLAFCRDCAEGADLLDGHRLSVDDINAFRIARGLPERDFCP